MQGVGDGQAQSAKRSVAGGYGQYDNAEQGDDTADVAENVLADDTDGAGRKRGVRFLQAEIVNAHCAGGPDHSDEALKDHHVIERCAALALALHRAGDDGGLRGMEAGEYAAGNGDEEHGDKVVAAEVLGVVEHAVVHPHAVPKLNKGVALRKDADENADGGEEQYRAENGIDTADDRVDGENGRAEVIEEDDAVDDPCGHRGRLAGEAKDLLCGDVAGSIDKHRADEQQQDADKDIVDDVHGLVGVLLYHVGHLGAAVAQADHAGEVVVHCAAYDVADGDGDERYGSEQYALDGAEDGTGAGNVQKIDKAVLPARHRNIVNAVLLGVCRRLAVVRSEDLFTEAAVEIRADKKNNQTDNES